MQYRLVFIGFGNVARSLARLLLRKRGTLEARYGMEFLVTGIATGRHGCAVNSGGIDLEAALEAVESGGSLAALSAVPVTDAAQVIALAPGEVMFENSPVNHSTGEPALSHVRAALERGMHVVTANKGTVVHGYGELSELAEARGKKFLFESTVLGGSPLFSVFREALPAAELQSFRGIINATTNLILSRMETGESFEAAVRFCQSIGLAETDPSADVDGWDAAIKVAALVTVLMDVPLQAAGGGAAGHPRHHRRDGRRGRAPGKTLEAGGLRRKRRGIHPGTRGAGIAAGLIPAVRHRRLLDRPDLSDGCAAGLLHHRLGARGDARRPRRDRLRAAGRLHQYPPRRSQLMSTVYLALGSNLGDRAAHLRAALNALEPRVEVLAESKIYETPPWGFTEQPAFLNMAVKAETKLSPGALLKFLKKLEARLGREATFRYGPRVIDLDILFYDDRVVEEEGLVIPHPRMQERAFVLVPLADVGAEVVHPVLGQTVREMLAEVDAASIRPVDL